MSGGLIALLDDVAAMVKLTAASLDDVAAAAGRASVKAVGVVVDDTAVTPQYLRGMSPDRELPMIAKIARGSLFNKVVLILPVALLLSQFLPQAMPILLMIGGAYLCFEGAEKVYEAVSGHNHTEEETLPTADRENQMVAGAIRTDFILSAEIMAISLAEVAGEPLLSRALILLVVALILTGLVYGVVALIVKMDDVGLKLATQSNNPSVQALGRAMVSGMPKVMSVLSVVGTAAMIWVGGHIVLDALKKLGFAPPADTLHHWSHEIGHALPHVLQGFGTWLVETIGSGIVGLILGAVIVGLLHLRKPHH